MVSQSPNVQLAALVDPLIGIDDVFPWLASYPSVPHGQTLDSLPSGKVDALIVTASAPAHAEIAQRALELDLHVLIEKPFTTQHAEAEALVK